MKGLAKFKRDLPKNLKSLDVQQETIRNIVTGKLFHAIKEEGKSKTDLAKLLGVSKPAISSLLSGDRNFTIDKLTEISFHINRTPKISFEKNIELKTENRIFNWTCCAEQIETGLEIEHDLHMKRKTIRFSQKSQKSMFSGSYHFITNNDKKNERGKMWEAKKISSL